MKKGKDKKNRSFESKSVSSSPGERKSGSSPKRCRTEASCSMDNDNLIDNSTMDFASADNVVSHITIESASSPIDGSSGADRRLNFINSQRNNRYSASNSKPFLVHIESADSNIGNVHPMRLGKVLADHFPTINNIRRLGKNIIAINFKFHFDANNFVQSIDLLPDNWIPYIPNYKIMRSGVVRGVDPSLSKEEIMQGIKWRDRPMEIRAIERLKYRDSRNNNELRESNSVKIDFVTNLLPEYISIWSVRSRIRPYINKVRRCLNCLRWGHSSAFCRGLSMCSGCGDRHETGDCSNEGFRCPDCKQLHSPFDTRCMIFRKYELINSVMAYCNVSQFIAKKLIKKNNICSVEQVEKHFKSSAYLAWNNIDIFSNIGFSESESTPSVVGGARRSVSGRRSSSNRCMGSTEPNGDQMLVEEIGDSTLVPSSMIGDENYSSQERCTSTDKINHINNDRLIDNGNTQVTYSSLDNLYPSPGVIIRDIYDIYKGNESRRERDFAIINYLNLLFGKKV